MGPTQVASGRTQTELVEGYGMSVIEIPDTDAQSLAESSWSVDNQSFDPVVPHSISKIKVIAIGAKTGYQYEVSNRGSATVTFVPLSTKSLRIVGRHAGLTPKQEEEYQLILGQILSTFEFNDLDQRDNNDNEVSDLPSETIKYSPKSDWQTYSDETAGFSIQYSPESKVDDAPDITEKGKSVRILGCGFKNPQGGENLCLPIYSIGIKENYNGGSRRAWLKENIDMVEPVYYMDWIIGGKKALVAIGGNPGGSSWGVVLIPNGNKMYVYDIAGASWDPDTGRLPDLSGDKMILSTFKLNSME